MRARRDEPGAGRPNAREHSGGSGNRIRAGFLDDDPDAVRRLSVSGVRAHEAVSLAQLGIASLRGTLDAP